MVPLLVAILLLLLALCVTQWLFAQRQSKLRDQAQQDWRNQERLINERLVGAQRRRSELEAVISSMVEGVVVLDTEDRVISLNLSAGRLLSLDTQAAVGRPLHEVVRNVHLQALLRESITQRANASGEVTLRIEAGPSADDRSLQVYVSPIRQHADSIAGAVVVLHDITRLRQLESVRRDFVANVSHEIKTPISAVKAAVETLIDDPEASPADRERFLGMISRQADRLDAIVEDLLSLARLEQEADQTAPEFDLCSLRPLVTAACETCSAKADAKSIELVNDADPSAQAPMVPQLIEQALVNLIDNAIKYSPDKTTVRIHHEKQADNLVIAVTDQGRGIEPEHLPRVFERFYRTDRARSRVLGGTGLGLSIVRHVAETHAGRATAQSTLGQGSTFKLHLPLTKSV